MSRSRAPAKFLRRASRASIFRAFR
jgi:hypothetical protein